ncbi:glutathionylspermidine synthase family protein [Rhodoblastus acidophilus]|uniref:Glutathionylspermidine synthase family protein n=1 Tax=Candidatus Rhodoblastus alkanivorans TaxID=2954117 RepID=A0ABS9Z390_9HYPH|nr:glutathionylspermidine synthase family protein [Candidatus Rhodoblastus alkanivorans]MCI4677394.1 glutathionylspermidine synthase family protein [Candidatus Rhodoblastus alkanivorans]MCI4682129.1 glutathionylspermidine synthase family protein [Candidatus Rhodoblastus alkanivorans]MDI4639431.1 glutathionylspermidine synthase family protein [Rhodoblastus acidophilus]
MRREPSPVRPDFAEQAEKIGFAFAYDDGEKYWDESVRYVFSRREIEDDLEKAAAELAGLCHELMRRIMVTERMMARLGVPDHARDVIAESWRRRDPTLYGRFDLAYDGRSAPKLLEFNADTPTSLFESSVVQWFWLEQLIASGDLPKDADQFNSLHEKLIARLMRVGGGHFLHLACMRDSVEDSGTTAYLEECARQAGLQTRLIDMRDIGLKRGRGFVDRLGRDIGLMFKLYPWEWMFDETFGRAPEMGDARFIEPAWKMLLSNKGMLALAWEMAPGHPNLLPCFFEDDKRAAELGACYARKPLFSREGGNVELHDGAQVVTGPDLAYGGRFVRQALNPLPAFDGHYPVCGCWLVGDEPAGLGIREDVSPVTSNRSRFIPHRIED